GLCPRHAGGLGWSWGRGLGLRPVCRVRDWLHRLRFDGEVSAGDLATQLDQEGRRGQVAFPRGLGPDADVAAADDVGFERALDVDAAVGLNGVGGDAALFLDDELAA